MHPTIMIDMFYVCEVPFATLQTWQPFSYVSGAFPGIIYRELIVHLQLIRTVYS